MEISIFRPKQFSDLLRAYELLIDGKVISEIRAGQTVRVPLSENAKTLTAKIDWCSSNEFDLSKVLDGESLEVKNNLAKKMWNPFSSMKVMLFKTNSYLSIAKLPGNS